MNWPFLSHPARRKSLNFFWKLSSVAYVKFLTKNRTVGNKLKHVLSSENSILTVFEDIKFILPRRVCSFDAGRFKSEKVAKMADVPTKSAHGMFILNKQVKKT